MTELFPSDAELEGLSGLVDPVTGVYYPIKGEGLDWYVSFVKCIYRLSRNAAVGAGLRVYKTGDLVAGVKPGRFFDGTAVREYAGVADRVLTDNATNYLYLLADGTLAVSVAGFPDAAATPHVRLATVATSGGTFGDADITDWRAAHVFGLAGPVGAQRLAAGLAEMIPQVQIAVGVEAGNAIAVTVSVRSAAGGADGHVFAVEAWLSNAPAGTVTGSPPNGAVSWTTGAVIEEIAAKARWTVLTGATGEATLSVGHSTTGTWYLNAAVDGRVWSSAAIAFV
ncbi:MAG: hypothetical protein GXY33_13740 [Phycisphaerae bacterium]|nr:hypothetical protein [Phycisphaerae bacterium]